MTGCILKMLQLKRVVKLQIQAYEIFTCSKVACFVLRLILLRLILLMIQYY